MDNRKVTSEELRERLKQEELKENPFGAFGDGINRSTIGNLGDLVSSFGWKGTGVIFIVLIIGYVIYNLLI